MQKLGYHINIQVSDLSLDIKRISLLTSNVATKYKTDFNTSMIYLFNCICSPENGVSLSVLIKNCVYNWPTNKNGELYFY